MLFLMVKEPNRKGYSQNHAIRNLFNQMAPRTEVGDPDEEELEKAGRAESFSDHSMFRSSISPTNDRKEAA